MTTPRIKANFEAALDDIPVFPLPQVVLFPHAALPLHVFEPRYRVMVVDCLATHGAMAISCLLGGDDEQGRPRMASVAGGGIVIEHNKLPDGRFNLVVVGQARLRLEERDPGDRPYRSARATILPDLDVTVPEPDRAALVAAASMFASEVRRHDPNFAFKMPSTPDTGQLADLCAYQLVVDGAARQAILEAVDPRERVQLVIEQLALQHGTMRKSGRMKVVN